MKHIRLLSAVALFVMAIGAAADSALATEPVFPPAARLGMVPLVGLAPAKAFVGFETEDHSVRVLVGELPAEAYGEVVGAFKANPAGTNGVKPGSIETSAGLAYYTMESAKDGAANVRRYSVIVQGSTFSGYIAVQVPENASKIYTDEAVKQMFASIVIRQQVPAAEQLAQMPFQIGELSAFKNVRTLSPGSVIILADGDETAIEAAPFMVIGLVGGVPQQPEERNRFAQQVATTIPGVREVRTTASEPMRINGMPGYETRIDAVSGKDNIPVTVVQWLRFGGASAMRIIASSPRDEWPKAFPRFRAVRDGIQ
jgi:hypothetical protein